MFLNVTLFSCGCAGTAVEIVHQYPVVACPWPGLYTVETLIVVGRPGWSPSPHLSHPRARVPAGGSGGGCEPDARRSVPFCITRPVLESIARVLQLNEVERSRFFSLALFKALHNPSMVAEGTSGTLHLSHGDESMSEEETKTPRIGTGEHTHGWGGNLASIPATESASRDYRLL